VEFRNLQNLANNTPCCLPELARDGFLSLHYWSLLQDNNARHFSCIRNVIRNLPTGAYLNLTTVGYFYAAYSSATVPCTGTGKLLLPEAFLGFLKGWDNSQVSNSYGLT
jgi:hypothetical protein